MRKAFTFIEGMIVVAIVFAILAVIIKVPPSRHKELDGKAIRVGDEVYVHSAMLDGVVVDVLQPKNDGEQLRFVVRYRGQRETFETTTFFASELRTAE